MKSFYEEKILPNLEYIEKARQEGKSIRKIAQEIGVSHSALSRHLKKKEPIECQLVSDGARVEESLYKACTGYTAQVVKHYKVKRVEYDEITGKKIKEEEQLVSVSDEIYVPPNISAQKFYLVNRLPDRWKTRPGVEDEQEKGSGVIVIPEILEIEEAAEP